jgi:hypothetical protein
MAHSGKIFQALTDEDNEYFALLYKGIHTEGATRETARDRIRQSLSKLPEAGIVNLLCAEISEAEAKAHVEAIKNFCRQDKKLQAVWEKRLQEKSYITKETLRQDGKTISIFDHYLGAVCYSGFMASNFDRQDRSKALNLAYAYQNYHALLVKCKSILAILSAKPDALAQQQSKFNSAVNTLGNAFWSLGHFQAGSMLHQFKKIFKDDVALGKQTDDAMLREFIKAEALVETDQSMFLFSAVRGEKPLSEFLLQTFGVDSIAKVKEALKTNFTDEGFAINRDRAYADIIADLGATIDSQDSEDDSDEEDIEIAQMNKQLDAIKVSSAELAALIQQSLLNKGKSAAVQQVSEQKQRGNENRK